MANTKHEDAIMKMGFDYFKDTILKSLGIDYTYIETGFTELVELTIENLYMDFTFLTTLDRYIHIEFQTTDGHTPDLRRFHAYEATMSHKTGKAVITYVIFSGGIQASNYELDCGAYTYKVIPIYMSHMDSMNILSNVQNKMINNIALNDGDFAQLALTPVMASQLPQKELIKNALLIVKNYNHTTAQKTTAILYAFADKFLATEDLEEIKEAMTMTRLGQMLLDEGIEKGIEKGLEKGLEKGREIESRRFKKLITSLSTQDRFDDIERIATDDSYCEQLMKEFNL